MFGAWCALGGASRARKIIRSPAILFVGSAYLIFALLMTMAGRFETFGRLFPELLVSAFNPNDKTNLAPYRVVHFVIMAILVARFVAIDWPGLRSRWLRPLIVCGQRSLEVFCVGLFLSFVGHFLLELISDTLLAQVLVSIAGIGLMTAVAYYRSWSKKLDKRPSQRVPESSSLQPTGVRDGDGSGRQIAASEGLQNEMGRGASDSETGAEPRDGVERGPQSDLPGPPLHDGPAISTNSNHGN